MINSIQKLHVYKIIFYFEYKSVIVCYKHVKKKPKKKFVYPSNCIQQRFFMK
jgi:hypothetical protein